MKPDAFPPDILEFLALLEKHSVRYQLIGGTAVIYHDYARLTGDFDFLYERAPANAHRLWDALLEFWGGSVPALHGADELLEEDLIIQFGRPPNRIDLVSSLGSVPFDVAWRNRVDDHVDRGDERVVVRILGLDELRAAKREAGRAKDLDDLEHLPPSR
jgi:hypothetical protein